MSKKIIFITGLLVFGGLIGLRVTTLQKSETQRQNARPEQARPVLTEKPVYGSIEETAAFVGTVKGKDQFRIFSEAPGRLVKLSVVEGDAVKKGQVIALLDREITGSDYEHIKIRTPLDGLVARIYSDTGDKIAPETPVALIAGLDKVKIDFTVSSKDTSAVNRDNKIRARVDAYPSEIFTGKVNRLSLALDELTRTAQAQAVINNNNNKLKPGMFADITVISSVKEQALLIPEDAVLHDIDEDTSHVFVFKDGQAVKQDLETGILSNHKIEVLSGLKNVDEIIVDGHHFIQDGEPIRKITQ